LRISAHSILYLSQAETPQKKKKKKIYERVAVGQVMESRRTSAAGITPLPYTTGIFFLLTRAAIKRAKVH
jgi:uncharacterized membrane protein